MINGDFCRRNSSSIVTFFYFRHRAAFLAARDGYFTMAEGVCGDWGRFLFSVDRQRGGVGI
jgi:hypothetical protein